jgi:hypothetical protein
MSGSKHEDELAEFYETEERERERERENQEREQEQEIETLSRRMDVDISLVGLTVPRRFHCMFDDSIWLVGCYVMDLKTG